MISTIKPGKPAYEVVPPEVVKLVRAMALPEKEADLPFALRSDPAPPPVRLAGRRKLTKGGGG